MKNIKNIVVPFVSIFFLASFSLALAGSDIEVDDNGIILAGHDAVAYFTENMAVEGNKDFTSVYQGAIYRFKSAENRDAFNLQPAKYAPQFGGFCALGAAYGKKFEIDGKAFKVVNGKLYVNKNVDVAETWVEDEAQYIADADSKWNDIKSVPAKDL